VAVAPYYPPIVFDDDGRVAGLEADFAAGVAEGLGRPLVYVRMTRQELIPAVQSGRADIAMSGVSITAERSRRVLFTQPYLYVGQLSLIRIEDLGELSRPTALRRPGVRIGYVDGTTGAAYVAENLPNAETVAFATPEEGVRGLRERRVDIFIHDAPTVWRVGSAVDERELMGLYTPLTEEALAWAVSRNDPELRSRIDEMLARWRANGELDRVLNRWIPVRVEIHR
jgi:ABC-type amino acid transport substrate-binding protein